MTKQLSLFEEDNIQTDTSAKRENCIERQCLESKFAHLLREELSLASLVSYVGNKNVPVLRLYRYKEAFACSFVEKFISRFGLNEKDYLFDPFWGKEQRCLQLFKKVFPLLV